MNLHIHENIYVFIKPRYLGDRRGRDRMVVGFTTTYAISAYYPSNQGEVYNIM